MKLKFLTLAAVTVLLVSCNTQKNTVATTSDPATTTPVTTTPVAPAAALSLELAEGQNLYNNNCANCHKLFEPKKFTKEEWGPILVSMGKKAHLDNTQMASITNYIHSQL
ncbi:MAG: cytochrome c [Flavobacterium sp.]|jgi:cytochrome c5|nr:MAG: cytochrome c [Flavobacterium sp.]